MTRRRRPDGGVPALRNEDVTGLTEPKQDAVIEESGRDPDRGDAAREFLEAQHDEARDTESSAARRGAGPAPVSGAADKASGTVPPGSDTELEKHWDPESRRKSR
jgi:hypothetical protein